MIQNYYLSSEFLSNSRWIGFMSKYIASSNRFFIKTTYVDANVITWLCLCQLLVMHLDPPFVPVERSALGRVSVDPAADPAPLLRALIELGSHLARQHGARSLEITDLTWPRSPLHDRTIELGAVPWSRIVTKVVRPQR